MAAAHDRIKSAVAAARASRRAMPVGVIGCALAAGVLVLGNPFATRSAPTRAPQPETHLGAAGLSLPDPTSPAAPQPPIKEAVAPSVVPPAPVAPAPAPAIPAAAAKAAPGATPVSTPPAAVAKKMGGGKHATIIVETLPAKPIIPPFVPPQPAGEAPKPHPPLPLDTELEGKGAATLVPAASPASKTAATSLPRNG